MPKYRPTIGPHTRDGIEIVLPREPIIIVLFAAVNGLDITLFVFNRNAQVARQQLDDAHAEWFQVELCLRLLGTCLTTLHWRGIAWHLQLIEQRICVLNEL